MGKIFNFLKGLFTKKVLGDSYLLEYRYSGYPQKYFSKLHRDLNIKHKITHPAYHYVPHITIVGPIITTYEDRLIELIKEVVFKEGVHFHNRGNLISTKKYIKFDTDLEGKVLAIKIKPSKPLISIKKKIESKLNLIQEIRYQKYPKTFASSYQF